MEMRGELKRTESERREELVEERRGEEGRVSVCQTSCVPCSLLLILGKVRK